ncbi:MAG TPA: hypothetical protein VFZ21_01990, partial [Gemmatimonadaceae bacterium]|nr:hypothetical protein [Gemmatimonadaceae bacterium]
MTKLLATRGLATLACVLVPLASGAQESGAPRDTVLDTRLLPPEIEREVTEAFNDSTTIRATGAYAVD